MTNKTTKSALFTSSISLLLCFAMLLGTTFAWFTDSVKSANNIIKSGNLDVEMQYWDGDSWEDAQDAHIFDQEALWEPGHTEVAYLKIINNGSLGLKYNLDLAGKEKVGKNVKGEVINLSRYINYGVVELSGDTKYDNREDAIAAVSEFYPMIKTTTVEGTIAKGATEKYVAVVVTMPSTVGNEANPMPGTTAPSITLSVNLFAAQLQDESDTFGKTYDQYATYDKNIASSGSTVDADVIISTADEFVAAWANNGAAIKGKVVSLDKDIDMTGVDYTPVHAISFKFYGNGHTITGLSTTNSGSNGALVQYTGAASIYFYDLTLDGAAVTGAGYNGVGGFVGSGDTASNVYFERCTLKNSTISATDGWSGAFIGQTAGYNGTDGPVFCTALVKDCFVDNNSITNTAGAVGGAIGHAGQNAWTLTTIDNVVVTNNVFTAEKAAKCGIILGTAGNAEAVLKNIDATKQTNNTVQGTANSDVLIGRFVPSGTGTLTVNGEEKSAFAN